VAAADDDVEALEIELLDQRRKDRQALTVVATGRRKMLQERRMNPTTLDDWRDRMTDVKEREQLGLGIALAQHFEHPLAAPHAGQPVMDDCNIHDRRQLFATSL
jgi:hypothetical protein